MNQQQLNELFSAWCADVGMVMDSDNDRQDFANSKHLFDDPGSDVADNNPQP